MNLTIKDLSTSTELDCEAMSAVRGGTYANSAVQSILQAQDVMVPVANGSIFGAGLGDQHRRRRRRRPARHEPQPSNTTATRSGSSWARSCAAPSNPAPTFHPTSLAEN